MIVTHISNTEVSITLSDEQALELANLLYLVYGTGTHCATAYGLFCQLRSVGIIGGKDERVTGSIECS